MSDILDVIVLKDGSGLSEYEVTTDPFIMEISAGVFEIPNKNTREITFKNDPTGFDILRTDAGSAFRGTLKNEFITAKPKRGRAIKIKKENILAIILMTNL